MHKITSETLRAALVALYTRRSFVKEVLDGKHGQQDMGYWAYEMARTVSAIEELERVK